MVHERFKLKVEVNQQINEEMLNREFSFPSTYREKSHTLGKLLHVICMKQKLDYQISKNSIRIKPL